MVLNSAKPVFFESLGGADAVNDGNGLIGCTNHIGQIIPPAANHGIIFCPGMAVQFQVAVTIHPICSISRQQRFVGGHLLQKEISSCQTHFLS